MASVPGAISTQPAAETLQGQEALPLDQPIGNPVAATAMVVGNAYRIVTIGNTNWQTAGAPAGAVVGTLFTCESVGTGTGTAQRVDTRQAVLSALASFVLGSNANISALAAQGGQTAYGRAFLALLDQAAARDYIGIGPDDSLALTGLAVTGTATLSHIHGNLAGGLYAHVRNVSGGPIAAGTPLRVTGTVGDTTTLQVTPADASSAGTMPALFIASEALTATGAGTDGHATMTGEIGGLDTSGLTSGAPLYVRSGGGVFTSTRPAANAQQVATVGRVHGNTGSIHVLPWPVLGTAAAAAVGDFAAAGAPAAAVGAHEGAADPHPQYLTPAEGNAAYATAAQGALAGTAVQPDALAAGLAGKATIGAIGSSGLTMTVGVLGRESGTGAPQVFTLGSGLSVVNGVLTVSAGGSGTVTSIGLSVPTGFAVAGSPITTSGTLGLTFAAGYSLPTTVSQSSWDAAAVLAGTAVQPAGLANYVQTSDARLSDSREWSATTISQAEAEAGVGTTRRAFTAQRVFQTAAAWWAATASATGQTLATAANAAAARTTLGLGSAATAATGDFAAASHSQAASTISDSTATGRAVLTAADAAAARSAIGAGRDTDLIPFELTGPDVDAANKTAVRAFRAPFPFTLISSSLSSFTAAAGSAAFEADMRLNGTTVYSVKPQIAVGNTIGTGGTFATTSVVAGDLLLVDISQAGGGARLATLYVTIRRT